MVYYSLSPNRQESGFRENFWNFNLHTATFWFSLATMWRPYHDLDYYSMDLVSCKLSLYYKKKKSIHISPQNLWDPGYRGSPLNTQPPPDPHFLLVFL